MPDATTVTNVLLAVFTVVAGVVGFFLRRLILQNDLKIELLRAEIQDGIKALTKQIHEAELKAVVGDGKIREDVANERMPRAACDAVHQHLSEVLGRLFGTTDVLAKGVARIEGLLEKRAVPA